jgi:hypothetical protein
VRSRGATSNERRLPVACLRDEHTPPLRELLSCRRDKALRRNQPHPVADRLVCLHLVREPRQTVAVALDLVALNAPVQDHEISTRRRSEFKLLDDARVRLRSVEPSSAASQGAADVLVEHGEGGERGVAVAAVRRLAPASVRFSCWFAVALRIPVEPRLTGSPLSRRRAASGEPRECGRAVHSLGVCCLAQQWRLAAVRRRVQRPPSPSSSGSSQARPRGHINHDPHTVVNLSGELRFQ